MKKPITWGLPQDLPQTPLGFMTVNNIPLNINSKPECNKGYQKVGDALKIYPFPIHN